MDEDTIELYSKYLLEFEFLLETIEEINFKKKLDNDQKTYYNSGVESEIIVT